MSHSIYLNANVLLQCAGERTVTEHHKLDLFRCHRTNYGDKTLLTMSASIYVVWVMGRTCGTCPNTHIHFVFMIMYYYSAQGRQCVLGVT
eukprot:scaffold103475_cov67-Attheya_sp.AAC.1